MATKRLVLIDGNAILHRAYHALPKLTSKTGVPTNAVYGFCSMLLRIINDLKPQYLAVAFDRPEPTFRHQEFVGYQAQRPKIEEDLASQIDKVKELLAAMGITTFEKPGFEADDLIGTIAFLASNPPNPLNTIIVSGDKDLMQLVNENTKLYLPVRGLSQGELVDEKGVEKKLGIKPKQVIDYKGLVGDPSDNYPGVPGIGPKTAVQLLNKFGTLEKIYAKDNLGVTLNIVKKLHAGHESALLSQKLATIITNVPFSLDWEKLKLGEIQNEKALAILKKLGFKSLVKRLENPRVEKSKPKGDKQLKLIIDT